VIKLPCGKVLPYMDVAARPLKILIVEDEPANAELLRASLDASSDEFLRRSSTEVAGSLAEARVALAANAFDLLLLDMWLPDGDGLSLARDVWAQGSGRPLIVVVSGSTQPAERLEALAVADEFLLKPFEPANLVATINRLARRR
jgi:DNA-binding response OmpR family regulator